VLIVGILLLFACKSAPKAAATTEEAFKNLYDRFRKDLILDGAEKYTVESGDTLSAIAREKYPSGMYYPIIMLASSDVVLDPDLIEPGMELTVPNLQKNLDSPKAKANIKKFLIVLNKKLHGIKAPLPCSEFLED
jgi:hypothetical protein